MTVQNRNKWATWTTFAFLLVAPLENIYKIEQIYYILAILVLAALIIISPSSKNHPAFPKSSKYIIFYVAFATLSTLWSLNTNALSDMVVFFAVFFFLLLQSAFYYDSKNLRLLKIGFILQGIVTLYVCHTHGEVVDNRFWIKSDESGADPNYLAGWFLLPMAFIGEFFFKKGVRLIYRVAMAAIIVNIFYFVMLSGSRAGLATCTIALLSPFLVLLKNNAKKNPFYSVLAIGGMLGSLYLVANNMSDVMTSRVEETHSMGARGIIWNDLMDAMASKPLNYIWGYGQYSTTLLNRVHNSAHNTFLDLFVDTGLIGLIPILLFIYRGVMAAYKCKEYEIVILALSMCTLVFSLTALTTRFFTSFLFLMAIAQNQFNENWMTEKDK